MKKKILLMFFASILLLAACGDESDSSSEEEAPGEVEEVSNDDKEADESADEEESSSDDIEESNEVSEGDDYSIVLDEPIEFGDFTMTITNFSLGVDYEGNDALIIEYDWENTSEESASPFMTFHLKAFQDNVETDDAIMVDGVDLGIGQKEIKSGGEVTGAQDIVGIEDLDQPLELELEELFSFDDEVYSTTIDLSELE